MLVGNAQQFSKQCAGARTCTLMPLPRYEWIAGHRGASGLLATRVLLHRFCLVKELPSEWLALIYWQANLRRRTVITR
jgi:hypothetical protein